MLRLNNREVYVEDLLKNLDLLKLQEKRVFLIRYRYCDVR